jgi:tellurite resistance protein TehA-like permease
MIRRNLATLDPGYFAWVMGSGIVSVGAKLFGFLVLSRVLFGVTAAAYVILVVAYTARAIFFWPFFRRNLVEPTTAMGYFTIVAGTSVLGIRFAMAGFPLVTLGLAAAGALVWLVLTYGLPWSVVAEAHRPVLGEVNGTWLIWVVATQSLSIVAALLAPTAPSESLRTALPDVAVVLWGVGLMLYLILIVVIFMRLVLVEVTPAEMGPAYWIAMGATAITARAAAGILVLHGHTSAVLVADLRPFLLGFSVVLWSFGTWWIPLLVLFGLWRHVLRRYPWAYEPRLWSVVFPLGMYTVASETLGRAAGLAFMVSVARVWLWVGVAAWAAVISLMVAAGIMAVARHQHNAS